MAANVDENNEWMKDLHDFDYICRMQKQVQHQFDSISHDVDQHDIRSTFILKVNSIQLPK